MTPMKRRNCWKSICQKIVKKKKLNWEAEVRVDPRGNAGKVTHPKQSEHGNDPQPEPANPQPDSWGKDPSTKPPAKSPVHASPTGNSANRCSPWTGEMKSSQNYISTNYYTNISTETLSSITWTMSNAYLKH